MTTDERGGDAASSRRNVCDSAYLCDSDTACGRLYVCEASKKLGGGEDEGAHVAVRGAEGGV